MTDDIDRIVRGLSKAQRDGLAGAWQFYGELHAFPRAQTCRVLHRLGLWRWCGTLTPLGIAVRNRILEG